MTLIEIMQVDHADHAAGRASIAERALTGATD
jgi:hypothetical protein